ncbi:MAG: RagB/SusD family nutrient uptake outer membrane protein [Bacteroidia bacterium]|nr:RagB/SusD family nutrient uptake outer membrane protein [Bacteroidia bacterium]
MKTKKIIIFFSALTLLISSCKDLLEPWPNGNYDNNNIWEYQNMVQGIINRCYDNIDAYSVGNSNRAYNDNEGAFLDGVTDDAVITSTSNTLRRYAVNAMTSSNDPFATYWDRDYRSISQCNIFLKDNRGLNTRYMVKTMYNDQVRHRLQGEAFALRAYFEWDLLQKFGGMGTNGQMLGFPIVTDVVDPYGEINYARATYDDCVKQIIRDCDSALYWLPLAYRDFLYTSLPAPANDLTYQGGKYWNRFDDTGVWGIKANVYLTYASPRFNPSNDINRWDSAAKYSMKLVNFKLITDQIASTSSFRPQGKVDWFNPNSPEIVFSTRVTTNARYMESMFYPGNFQGNGELGATQELVNAFGMQDGRPISGTGASPLWDATKPYDKRDPRFYSVIFYNGSKANRLNDITKPMYTFENWNVGVTAPGKDVAGARSDNSRTNYHIKKYVYMDVNWADASVKYAPHSKFIFRWAHFVLSFAEAANQVTGNPNTALYGMTPRAAIAYLRARSTYDNVTPAMRAADPYLTEVAGLGKAAFDAFVKNERRIETCFEGMRFYDIRRWTTGDRPGEGNWESVIDQPVHGAYITQTAPNTYTYDLNWQVEERALPSPYNPVPYYEMLRMDKLVQNVGWPTWE